MPEVSLEIRIYLGADGKFELFDGDNYNYEKGNYIIIQLSNLNRTKTWSIKHL